MRKTLIIARILTWFNLIFWGGFLVLGLLGVLLRQQIPALVGIFLFCAIPLHSYAAVQLQKAIRNPNLPLSHHTPTGIRFIGLIALFFGIVMMGNAYVMLSDPKTALEVTKQSMPDLSQVSDAQTLSWMHPLGIFLLIIGGIVILNVILNSRLLRWYNFVKQSEKRNSDNRNSQSRD